MFPQLVVLDGLPASGKSVLLSLLDGHDSLFVNPFHDGIISEVYSNTEAEQLILRKSRKNVDKILENTGYYRLKEMSKLGRIPIPVSSKNSEWKNVALNLDFNTVNQKLYCDVLKGEIKSRLDFVNSHLSVLNKELDEKSRKACFYVTMATPKLYAKELLSDTASTKIIHVRRDIDGIAYSISRRGAAPGRSSADNDKFSLKKTLINAWHWASYYRYIDNLKKEYPERILIVNFNEMFSNTSGFMENICDFIGVEFSHKMVKESWLNGKVVGDFIGDVQDVPKLTCRERLAIKIASVLPDFNLVRRWFF